METVLDIVKAFGGRAAFARAMGKPVATVNTWIRRGSFPKHQFVQIVEAGEAHGIPVTYEALAKLQA